VLVNYVTRNIGVAVYLYSIVSIVFSKVAGLAELKLKPLTTSLIVL
jgi:hypothetical protein